MSIKTEEPVLDSVAKYLSHIGTVTKQWDNEVRSNNEIAEEDKPTIKFFFRGHGNIDWKLRPSLFRPISGADVNVYEKDIANHSYYRQEQYITQEAIRLYPNVFTNAKTDIERMAICQHYALPTRLLDVSGNALVALYFAVATEEDKDGCVYVFRATSEDYKKASTAGSLDNVNILRYHDNGSGPIASTKRILLVFPPHETIRQKAQYGGFFLFENSIKPFVLNGFAEGEFRRIKINQNKKSQLLNELESICNIHKGTLFPETLDGYVDKLKKEAETRINADNCTSF